MRISDWSSDVCSSDLGSAFDRSGELPRRSKGAAGPQIDLLLRRHRARILAVAFGGRDNVACRCTLVHCRRCRIAHIRADARIGGACVGRLQQTVLGGAARGLSAEHSFQGLTTGVVGCRPSSRARLGWNKREVRWDNERSSTRNGEFVRSVPVEYTPARTTGGKAESHGTKAEARNKFTPFFSPLWSPCRAAGERAQAGSKQLWYWPHQQIGRAPYELQS